MVDKDGWSGKWVLDIGGWNIETNIFLCNYRRHSFKLNNCSLRKGLQQAEHIMLGYTITK